MKVGDYVRTEYGIAKYISDKVTKYGMYYVVDKDIMTCNVEGWENCISGSNEIIKSSPNLIDLIEVGDYVNGHLVKHIAYFEGVEEPIKKLIFADEYHLIPTEVCEQNEIKSIVTKEQFESMEYKVKE